MAELSPIPSTPCYPLIQSLPSIEENHFLLSVIRLAEKHGPLFRLPLPGGAMLIASNHEFLNELCDQKRFHKECNPTLQQLRNGLGDGLFTANPGEVNWGIAHRVLMPAFGPLSMNNMYPEMHEVATQLALKWARQGPSEVFEAAEDFTRLALDTIALCSMGFRFNSFYHDNLHPFVQSMGDFLVESGVRSRRPDIIPSFFYRDTDKRYFADIENMRKTAENVIKERKETPADRKDLLTAMLDGVDKSGEKLGDANIINNLITFLIAGHETTSGMLAFAFYQLLSHPDTYARARKEVDEVVGTGPIRLEHLNKLSYIPAVLRETLRVCPTIPVFGVVPNEDTVLGGKYEVKKGERILALIAKAHLDPLVYGDDAKEFRPERMLDENFKRLNKEFPNCWKPFGNGMRACIGRPFAWQEGLLMMTMALQNFDFEMADNDYELEFKEMLTIKPLDFKMRAKLRNNLTPNELSYRLAGTPPPTSAEQPKTKARAGKGRPMSIYYGSNTGTCKAMAQQLASDSAGRGFEATVLDLDDFATADNTPVVIITASYEGQPPDNAAKFFSKMQNLNSRQSEVPFAVFGCGNREWTQTFHRVPRIIDDILGKYIGTRIAPMGSSDAANGEMFSDFERWEDSVFWPAMAEKYGLDISETRDSGLSVEISAPRASALGQHGEATVVATRVLTSGAPVKRHLEIKLPDANYAPGDYLAVLPMNPKDNIHRVMRRFGLARDAYITITSDKSTVLPTDVPVAVYDVLSSYVELGLLATRRGIQRLADLADGQMKKSLAHLGSDGYPEASAKKLSLLDIVESYPTLPISFGSFLSLLPPMMVRQYSVSSSPNWKPGNVTLTYSVLDQEHSSDPTRRHIGVASSYLSSLLEGDKLRATIRPSHASFHLPDSGTALICIATGSGIAPFRSFIQERVVMIAKGLKLAPALLFFGCRAPGIDDLYREELDEWEAKGAVDVRRAYSRQTETGCKYVQDRMLRDKQDVLELWERGGKVFVCGSRAAGDSVRKAFISIMECSDLRAATEDEKTKWFDDLRNVRYSVDVFD